MTRLILLGTAAIFGAAGLPAAEPTASRVSSGLQVLYDFSDLDDGSIKDRSENEAPVDLKIVNSSSVWQTERGLSISGQALIRSDLPPRRLTNAVRESGAVSVEVWMRPANLKQSGPARIVTLSGNGSDRNFTLGQDGDRIEARLRTTETNTNGIPSLRTKSKALKPELTHVVYTRGRSGGARIYVNGILNSTASIIGELSNWDDNHPLGLANELSSDRPWQGTFRLVALYSRELQPDEVIQNFRAGPNATLVVKDDNVSAKNAQLFEYGVAAVFSRHCIECHDAATRQGGLDLSRKSRALQGGEQGPPVVPKQPGESLLWTLVDADAMPHDRPPLSDAEKTVLHEWIKGGAEWTLETIDPAVYVHGEQSQKVFVQRLTVPEYIATVRNSLGVDIATEARQLLPQDLRADGFSNTAYNLNVDLSHIEAYAKLAEIIVDRLNVNELTRRHTKSRELTDENLTKFIQPVGRQLLRGPLNRKEVQLYCGISTTVAASGGDIDDAVRYIIEAMLQSPRFLYRIESQRGDGSRWPVSQHELASRLSYILWGASPDDVLLNVADAGKLDRADAAEQVQRMLGDRRAVARSRQFIAEWLNLNRLDNLRPDPEKFPDWNRHLATDMQLETLEFFEEIAWRRNRPLTDLFNVQLTFVTPRLARHYNLPVKLDGLDDEVQQIDLTQVAGRGGLLTHGSVLTIGGDDASTVARGLFVMHELLRGVVRDPPPCVDTTPAAPRPGLTQRAIAEQRIANKSCTGCHSKFEPLSFGLERFDGLGAFHWQDRHGNKLREDGIVSFPGEEELVAYKSTAQLMDLLADSPRVRESLTWKVTQFAVGRPLGPEDASIVARIHQAAQDGGGTWSSLMTAIVMSDLVWTTRTEPESQDQGIEPRISAQ